MPVKVPRLDQPPHRCAFTLRDQDAEGFFTGQTLSGWDPFAAISISYVRTLARELDYVHPDDHRRLVDERAAQEARIEQLEAENAELAARLAAVDLLESAGFTARKKPGRPAAATTAKEKA